MRDSEIEKTVRIKLPKLVNFALVVWLLPILLPMVLLGSLLFFGLFLVIWPFLLGAVLIVCIACVCKKCLSRHAGGTLRNEKSGNSKRA